MLKTAFTEETQDLGHMRTLTIIVLSATSWHKRTVLCLVEWCNWKLDTVTWVLTLREWEFQNAIAPANAINLKWPTTYWRTAPSVTLGIDIWDKPLRHLISVPSLGAKRALKRYTIFSTHYRIYSTDGELNIIVCRGLPTYHLHWDTQTVVTLLKKFPWRMDWVRVGFSNIQCQMSNALTCTGSIPLSVSLRWLLDK